MAFVGIVVTYRCLWLPELLPKLAVPVVVATHDGGAALPGRCGVAGVLVMLTVQSAASTCWVGTCVLARHVPCVPEEHIALVAAAAPNEYTKPILGFQTQSDPQLLPPSLWGNSRPARR